VERARRTITKTDLRRAACTMLVKEGEGEEEEEAGEVGASHSWLPMRPGLVMRRHMLVEAVEGVDLAGCLAGQGPGACRAGHE
jgi:hypothetical protein